MAEIYNEIKKINDKPLCDDIARNIANAAYQKPETGIPKADLSTEVQEILMALESKLNIATITDIDSVLTETVVINIDGTMESTVLSLTEDDAAVENGVLTIN